VIELGGAVSLPRHDVRIPVRPLPRDSRFRDGAGTEKDFGRVELGAPWISRSGATQCLLAHRRSASQGNILTALLLGCQIRRR
jgi:hypothetical protein